jgi:ABC-type dipeptide/oligopeptide/nickel transport system permease subunit
MHGDARMVAAPASRLARAKIIRGVVTTWWTTFWPAAAIAFAVLCLMLSSEAVRRALVSEAQR